MSDEKNNSAQDELFEAIEHFKSAAGMLFDKASTSATKGASSAAKAVDDARAKVDPAIRDTAKKADDFVAKNIDPALDSATREAERVIKKLGDGAEPLARQLAGELGRLTRRLSDALDGAAGKGDAEDEDAAE